LGSKRPARQSEYPPIQAHFSETEGGFAQPEAHPTELKSSSTAAWSEPDRNQQDRQFAERGIIEKQQQQGRPSQQPGEPPEQQPGKPHEQQGRQHTLCKQRRQGQQTNSSYHNHLLLKGNKRPFPQLKSKGNNSNRHHLHHSRDSNNQEPQDHQDLQGQLQTWRHRIHHPISYSHWPQH